MKIMRAGSWPTKRGPESYFRAPSCRTRYSRNQTVCALSVSFAPGAHGRHTHPLGQTLSVLSGAGRVQPRADRCAKSGPATRSGSRPTSATGTARASGLRDDAYRLPGTEGWRFRRLAGSTYRMPTTWRAAGLIVDQRDEIRHQLSERRTDRTDRRSDVADSNGRRGAGRHELRQFERSDFRARSIRRDMERRSSGDLGAAWASNATRWTARRHGRDRDLGRATDLVSAAPERDIAVASARASLVTSACSRRSGLEHADLAVDGLGARREWFDKRGLCNRHDARQNARGRLRGSSGVGPLTIAGAEQSCADDYCPGHRQIPVRSGSSAWLPANMATLSGRQQNGEI